MQDVGKALFPSRREPDRNGHKEDAEGGEELSPPPLEKKKRGKAAFGVRTV